MSAIIPGAGQFYVNRRNVRAFIYPLLEIGLWYGMLHFRSRAYNKERAYERFADLHYCFHHRQLPAQKHLVDNAPEGSIFGRMPPEGWWDDYRKPCGTWVPRYRSGGHFRLIGYYRNDRQQFYEALGKYDKYIFGWSDWWIRYVGPIDQSFDNIDWYFDGLNWIGNIPVSDPYALPSRLSPLREEYRRMRWQAEDYWKKSRYFTFGIIAHHLVSAVDARIMANRHNTRIDRQLNTFVPSIEINIKSNYLTPMIGLQYRF
jgi:hypothetical protein